MLSEEAIWNIFLKDVKQNTNTFKKQECTCQQPIYVETEGYKTCTICGWVANDVVVDRGCEWNNYKDKRTNPARAHRVDPLLPKSSMGTWAIVPKGYRFRHRLPTWFKRQHWGAIPGKERRQKKVFLELEEAGVRLGIPKKVIYNAKVYYKLISDHQIARIKAMRVTCLYFACKENGHPRDGQELAETMGYDPQKITRSNKLFLQILQELKAKPRGDMTIQTCQFASSKAQDHINRYTYKLGLPFWINEEIRLVIRNVRRTGVVSNRSPISLAASCTFFTARQYGYNTITSKDISRVFNISIPTFHATYLMMLDHDYLLFLSDDSF